MIAENKNSLPFPNPNYKGLGEHENTGVDNVVELFAVEAARRLMEKYTQEALTDELTGCYNRKAWEKFKSKFDPERDGRNTQFVFVDLNDLREINNTKGHHAGDDALKRVVDCLDNEMRKGDTIYRLGGDEFGIVCHNNSEVIDPEVFQRSLIERMKYIINENPATNFAFGITGFDNTQDKTLDDTMKRADALMYNNKAEVKKREQEKL